ncbi:MAG TPA: hypothetical protein VK831_00270 [Candidatus Deferrimicrobiaceae bacterium]|nr:hypothetical protein [Candidatus Deferrimicrobiaceae bacterium]
MDYDPNVAPGGRPEGDLGLGEPLRLPDGLVRAWRRSVGWFNAQPVLARLFIALSGLDLIARAVGVVGPPMVLDAAAPFAAVTSILPHNLLILLPALIVIRRPGATEAAPNLVDGAIFVALVELLSHPSTALASTIGGIGPWGAVAVGAVVLGMVGWVGIGRGLSALNLEPSTSTAGWANVAAAGILAAVGFGVLTYLIGPGIDVGDPEINGLLTLNTLAHIVAPVALAYAGRAVVRGLDDTKRPEIALRLGASAVFLAAGLGLLVGLIVLLAVADVSVAQSITDVDGWGVLYWLATGGAVSLLIVAFGLGLAGDDQQSADEAVTLGPT